MQARGNRTLGEKLQLTKNPWTELANRTGYTRQHCRDVAFGNDQLFMFCSEAESLLKERQEAIVGGGS